MTPWAASSPVSISLHLDSVDVTAVNHDGHMAITRETVLDALWLWTGVLFTAAAFWMGLR